MSGAARGLGLTQAEALLEAGATVYALDRLPEPSPDFYRVQKRAAEELGTTFYYRQIDVREVDGLNEIIANIGDAHERMDGLIAAAGIQQETTALDYTAKDANKMFEINITGVFMTAQAVAKQMIRFGNGGSIAMIASMSAHIANRVCWLRSESSLSLHSADVLRVLSVQPTTHRKPACFNWLRIWPLSGASTEFESTQSLLATSSPRWSKSSSVFIPIDGRTGQRRICLAS